MRGLPSLPASWRRRPTPKPSHHRTPTGSSSQNENWCVVQEGDEFKPIRSTDLTNEKKRLADQYKADMKKWKADKVKDPDAPKPHKLIREGQEEEPLFAGRGKELLRQAPGRAR